MGKQTEKVPVTSGKYHSKAKTSKLKTGDHTPDQCNHRLNGQFIHYKPLRAVEGKETIKTYDADGARVLIVPNRNPIDTPAIIGQSEFERLKKQAHVVTLQDKLQMIEKTDQEKHRLIMESTQRKENLTRCHQLQNAGPGSKLSSVESEASDKNLYLLKRSHELQLEQDERVKQANGIILATKCRAIRNAQVAEKKLIEQQLKAEDQRLDAMMEQRRQKLMEIEDQKRETEEKKKLRYVQEVQQQMKENELKSLLEAEAVEEESRMINKALIAMQKEEEARLKGIKEKQMKMREEFKKANAETEHYRNMKDEEQRVSDMRIKEFMRQKAEREDAIEKEKLIIKKAKEKEIARLRALQEKSQDLQAELDEMNALRSQEEKEREWRENEKKEALKKRALIEDLQRARAKQIEDIRKTQARALARDEEDFMKVAKVQHELHQKDLEKNAKRMENVEKHRKELLQQINEKEKERIYWQRERFEDGKLRRLELELKEQNLQDYLKVKVQKLRDNNVPENYIKDIERQLALTANK